MGLSVLHLNFWQINLEVVNAQIYVRWKLPFSVFWHWTLENVHWYWVNPTCVVIELLCVYWAIDGKHLPYFRRNRCHNVKHFNILFISHCIIELKELWTYAAIFFSSILVTSLLSLPAGFSSCAIPLEFGSFLLFSPTKFFIKMPKI